MKNQKIRVLFIFMLVLTLIIGTIPTITFATDIQIKLDSKSLTMKVGNEEQLTATILPIESEDEGLKWYSDNKGIAEVDEDGYVTAKKSGKAKIYVQTLTSKKSAFCQVTVIGQVKVTGVALDLKSLKLKVGEEDQLVATVKPSDATNQEVIWSSSNKGLVEVDEEGNLYAKKSGKAKITATTVDGKKTAVCELLISEGVKVTGIALDKKSLSLKSGDELQLIATVKPSNASNSDVVWSTSNKGIVDVDDDGNITAISAGSAKITATTKDGNKTATCTVSVLQSKSKIASVTLNKKTATLEIGDSLTLVKTISPSTALNKEVSWSSEDPDIAEVDEDGNVMAIAEGTTDITVTTDDGDKTAICKVTVISPIVNPTPKPTSTPTPAPTSTPTLTPTSTPTPSPSPIISPTTTVPAANS